MKANYDADDQHSIAAFILDNMPAHKQFALGTIDDQGRPWVVCLNLTLDSELRFIWKSAIGTEHSKHLSAKPDVSICVFSEDNERGDFGFYARGRAHEITDAQELAHAIDVRFTQKGKPAPTTEELTGDSPARLYIAELDEAWVNDDRHVKTHVDLSVLRKVAQTRQMKL